MPLQSHRFLRLIWLVAILVVIIGSLLPGDLLPMREIGRLDINDKLEHFLAYTALAFLPSIHEKRRVLIFAALGLIAMGVLLEFAQRLSVERYFEIGDMVANAAGVCIGAAVGLLFRRRVMSKGDVGCGAGKQAN